MRFPKSALSALSVLAFGLTCFQAEAQSVVQPFLQFSQPIGKSLQPINPIIFPPSGPVPVPTVGLTQPLGVGLASSSPNLLFSALILRTDYPLPIQVESKSLLPAYPGAWTTSAATILPGQPFIFAWQPGAAQLGEQVGLDLDGFPLYAVGSLFIDPATIPDMEVFRQSHFTIQAIATPEPGAAGLLTGLAVSGLGFAARRRRRV
ncbi:MAG: hypothetical protein JWN14_3136 [Chthonomonadales bacterium]|nr:hypothetical protein [Chthonomonadales bacterium]